MSQPSCLSSLTRLCLRKIAAAALGAVSSLIITDILADSIRVVTEELPPYNMTQNGRITGMSTEVVQAVLKDAGLDANIEIMPWARAYDLALNTENILIYSITRTAHRERLFKWVGVIAPTYWHLYSLSNRNIKLRSLEDARRYQIATVKEDVGEQFLISNNFATGKNIQSSNKYQFNYEKLKQSHVDLWISNERNAAYLLRQSGDDPDKVLTRSLRLPNLGGKDGLSMAFSLKTSDKMVARLRQSLINIHSNGKFDAIARKWK